MERGDKAATDAAFAKAAHVVSLKIANNRLSANSMEGRTALGEYDPTGGKTTLHTSTQQPHKVRAGLAGAVFREPEMKFRVVAPDVGGGFGMKGGVFPEDALVAWAARKVLPPGEMGLRALRRHHERHPRPRQRERSLARARPGRQVPRAAGRRPTIAQGAYLAASAGVPAGMGSMAYTNCLRHPGGAHCAARGLHQHHAGRPLSRRRQAGSDLRDGAAGRSAPPPR